MKDIKLVAIDVDGTLVNQKKELMPAVRDAVIEATQQGTKVVICTGRPLPGVVDILKKLQLDNQDDQYLICFGGAAVATTSGHEIYQQGITYDDYIDLEAIAFKMGLHFQVLNFDKIYTPNRDLGYYTIFRAMTVAMPVAYRTISEMKDIPIIKGMFIDAPEVLDKAIKDRRYFSQVEDRMELTKTAPYYYEAYAKGVSKGSGLKKLCEKLGIKAENVMAIGDEANDLSMIKYAGTGVAMGNAIPEVKATADEITDDNEHDGVAKILQKLVLK